MDAAAALADLTEISSQVEAAVVVADDGAVVASTFGDETPDGAPPAGRSGLLEAAERVPSSAGSDADAARGRAARRQRLRRPRGGRRDRRDHDSGADRRARLLRPRDLPARGRREPSRRSSRRPSVRSARARLAKKKTVGCVGSSPCSCWSAASLLYLRGAATAARERVDLYYDDGSMVSLERAVAPRRSSSRSRARSRRRCEPTTSSATQLREHALLEGDFVLRSGRRSPYYLDKYRFETRPELLGPLGERLAGGRAGVRAGRDAARRRRSSARSRSPPPRRSRRACPS